MNSSGRLTAPLNRYVNLMNMASRLASIAPDIEFTLSELQSAIRFEVALKITTWAMEKVGLQAEMLTNQDSKGAKAVSDIFDERYFKLDEQGSPDYLVYFSKARAASSIAFLLDGNAYEAIYEAVMATDDMSTVQQLLHEAIEPKV